MAYKQNERCNYPLREQNLTKRGWLVSVNCLCHELSSNGAATAFTLFLTLPVIELPTYIPKKDKVGNAIPDEAMRLLNERIWTPPRLQTIRLQAVRYDCSRISGLILLHLLQVLDPDGLFAR